MVENKADWALKNTSYELKLILGSTPDRESQIIDISEPVKEALTRGDLFPDNLEECGIAKRILGLWESSTSPNWLETAPMYTYTADIVILQDINRIIDAAIVNTKQATALKELISEAFRNRERERMAGMDYVFGEHYGFVSFPDRDKK